MQRSVLKLIFVVLAATGSAGLAAVSAATADEPQGATCSSDNGVAKIAPGIEEVARVQNITVKGLLGECTGSVGASAKYVAHVKTTAAVTCASLNGEGATSEGTVLLKWGHGKGNSQGTLIVTGSPAAGFTVSGKVTQGPYAGLSISSTVSGTPVFTGKGEPCTKKNKLKQINVAGTSPFTIA